MDFWQRYLYQRVELVETNPTVYSDFKFQWLKKSRASAGDPSNKIARQSSLGGLFSGNEILENSTVEEIFIPSCSAHRADSRAVFRFEIGGVCSPLARAVVP